jgi:hypothetical protein
MNPQGRGRGRGMFGRGYGCEWIDFLNFYNKAYFVLHQVCFSLSDYPQFAPFGSFPPTLGYPLPGYPAAAAAANAAYTAQQQPGKPPRNTERSRPNFAFTYPSIPSR